MSYTVFTIYVSEEKELDKTLTAKQFEKYTKSISKCDQSSAVRSDRAIVSDSGVFSRGLDRYISNAEEKATGIISSMCFLKHIDCAFRKKKHAIPGRMKRKVISYKVWELVAVDTKAVLLHVRFVTIKAAPNPHNLRCGAIFRPSSDYPVYWSDNCGFLPVEELMEMLPSLEKHYGEPLLTIFTHQDGDEEAIKKMNNRYQTE